MENQTEPMLTVKVTCGGQTRRFNIPKSTTPTWDDLIATISLRCQLDPVAQEKLVLTWIDGDGDVITLSSSQELSDLWKSLDVGPQTLRFQLAFQSNTDLLQTVDEIRASSIRSSVESFPVRRQTLPKYESINPQLIPSSESASTERAEVPMDVSNTPTVVPDESSSSPDSMFEVLSESDSDESDLGWISPRAGRSAEATHQDVTRNTSMAKGKEKVQGKDADNEMMAWSHVTINTDEKALDGNPSRTAKLGEDSDQAEKSKTTDQTGHHDMAEDPAEESLPPFTAQQTTEPSSLQAKLDEFVANVLPPHLQPTGSRLASQVSAFAATHPAAANAVERLSNLYTSNTTREFSSSSPSRGAEEVSNVWMQTMAELSEVFKGFRQEAEQLRNEFRREFEHAEGDARKTLNQLKKDLQKVRGTMTEDDEKESHRFKHTHGDREHCKNRRGKRDGAWGSRRHRFERCQLSEGETEVGGHGKEKDADFPVTQMEGGEPTMPGAFKAGPGGEKNESAREKENISEAAGFTVPDSAANQTSDETPWYTSSAHDHPQPPFHPPPPQGYYNRMPGAFSWPPVQDFHGAAGFGSRHSPFAWAHHRSHPHFGGGRGGLPRGPPGFSGPMTYQPLYRTGHGAMNAQDDPSSSSTAPEVNGKEAKENEPNSDRPHHRSPHDHHDEHRSRRDGQHHDHHPHHPLFRGRGSRHRGLHRQGSPSKEERKYQIGDLRRHLVELGYDDSDAEVNLAIQTIWDDMKGEDLDEMVGLVIEWIMAGGKED